MKDGTLFTAQMLSSALWFEEWFRRALDKKLSGHLNTGKLEAWAPWKLGACQVIHFGILGDGWECVYEVCEV